MQVLELILCILLLLIGVALVVIVLMQQGKSKGLSGTIAGGADTFFGKTKGKSKDAILSKLAAVLSIVFAVMVLLVYVISDTPASTDNQPAVTTSEATTEEAPATSGEATTEEAPATSGEATTEEAPASSGAAPASSQTAE